MVGMRFERSSVPALLAVFVTGWVALTVLALAWSTAYNWPDYNHVDYGLPFVWATHTLNTIAGPVDVWRVDFLTLLMNLVIWLGSMAIAVALMLTALARKKDAKTDS